MKKRLQVFVSSTYTDLTAERQAAVGAILKAGHIPAGMELFTAGDESQMEVIKRWIDESDVYMLILGGRYGSIEPRTKLSYTELEYDYATETRKPLFAVVVTQQALDEKVRSDGTAVIELENPQGLKAFREKVLSRISSFFGTPQDIRLAVFETLSDFVQRHEFAGWVSATTLPDVTALAKQIADLSQENSRLQAELQKLQSQLDVHSEENRAISFEEAAAALDAVKLEVPAAVKAELGMTTCPTLELIDALGELMIRGVYNKYDASETHIFLYHHLMPRLQYFSFAESEAVPEVVFRRYALTRRGIAFLAFIRGRRTEQHPLKPSAKSA